MFSSETSVDFQQTTWCYIPEDRTHYNHLCENLSSSYCLIPLQFKYFPQHTLHYITLHNTVLHYIAVQYYNKHF
jgi:hypothetical protein